MSTSDYNLVQISRTQVQLKKRLVAKYKDINLKVSGLAGN